MAVYTVFSKGGLLMVASRSAPKGRGVEGRLW